MQKIRDFTKQFENKNLPDIKVGDTVKVHQRIKEGDKERIQVFEGLVLSNKHGKGIQGTIAVRRIISGVGVEKTFPLHSPLVEKIEIVSRGQVRRSKLYYLRERVGKKAKIRRKDYTPGEETIVEEQKETPEAEKTEETPTPEKTEAQPKKKDSPEPQPKEEKK